MSKLLFQKYILLCFLSSWSYRIGIFGVGPRGLQAVLSVRVDQERYQKQGLSHKVGYNATHFNV
jgi:hypothetical protein